MSAQATPAVAIRVSGLSRSFGATRALTALSLTVQEGELYGLVGPDGAGKSTAISCLAGLLAPSAGEVRVLGDDPLARGSTVREQLGLMPQQYSLYGDLTVDENLQFFARLFGIERSLYRERRERLLAITHLARFGDRRADALSGGMYKKLALACALLHRPRVLLLDEPTNGVDPVSRRELWELLYELVGEGMTVLVSTPSMDEAERCHRVGLLSHGRLVASGAPSALARGLEHEVYELTCAARSELEQLLAAEASVLSAKPRGARTRILVEPGAGAALTEILRAHGVLCARVAPSFEELFLARTLESEVAA